MIVQLTTRARAEFNSALAFLNELNPHAADDLRDGIEAAIARLSDLPSRGRPGAIAGTRELVVLKTPYVMVYAASDERVLVLRIRHTSQDPTP